jgi:hypothetical protein
MTAIVLIAPLHPEHARLWHSLVLLYVGPDQILPLTSALGAILGVLLMFWHRLKVLPRKAWRGLFARRAEPAEPATPEQ